MTHIEIKLIPDGSLKLPREAQEHSIISKRLKGVSTNETPAPDWRDFEKRISGDSSEITFRLYDTTMEDYSTTVLDAYIDEVASINGVKRHPNGWTEVEEQ